MKEKWRRLKKLSDKKRKKKIGQEIKEMIKGENGQEENAWKKEVK
jgi:hypothetical protein